MRIVFTALFFIALLPIHDAAAQQDTTTLTVAQCEDRFLASNVRLLAARLNIDAAEAAIVQAAVWNNPNLAVDQNLYNRFSHRVLDVTKSGNTDIQLQQLFVLAGKRGKQVRLAEISRESARRTFEDVLRSLRYELRTDHADLYYLQRSLRFYDESIGTLTETVASAEAVYAQRSLLLAELLRLKSLLLSLQNDRLDILTKIADLQAEMRTLMNDTSRTYYRVVLDRERVTAPLPDSLSLETVVAAAVEHRPDLAVSAASVEYETANLALQQALQIPDLTVGAHYSRAGNYVPDYLGVTFSIDLPFFNRNQGNIAVSERTIEMNRAMVQSVRQTVVREATAAFEALRATDQTLRGVDRNFPEQYGALASGMAENYRKRNITIIEFTDFFESYRASTLQFLRMENARVDAAERLNYTAGVPLIRF